MTESVMTKEVLSKSLIELCHYKRFEKITISDITQRCKLNRQTFYYHFSDKFDLLGWTYQHTAIHYLKENVTLENWHDQVLKMLQEIQSNAAFYRNTVQDESALLANQFSQLTCELFLELFSRLDNEERVSKADRHFYATFFSYGCGGMLIAWIVAGFKEDAEELAASFARLAKDTEKLAYQLYCEIEN
ncbi:TetR family transcriptional regulator [Carnobacterium divergens]|uniref:TetR/AcrR family transcriptional regulator C-terminal domain-containing protein n=1 Tax=Carnobacterium divergens TaxID=2748 RepID=UPI001071A37A|nr:TetR/AcrR family transcriptional regulator C-terminal domain-containing protein [Carnobacterium divergens]TFJ38920.1 TetR family transcriptional regulator [Carnobacterium divergens]TFJ48155.1 TetR family transcriptional regulator [Carnobacterium divergens]TFJ53119.1 TetR family transcriptional regulator [Carnobacterium divergens]TFJ57206.1 TetR family transcriptional regulator [Carnobacterium divergens]TFJ68909.1 TetR family transcriptional regulator [Carnobacterium divergens]